jgi:hypothetical protein
MKCLLLVESFDLCPSNHYILVRVIPSCFRFVKMCLCQVSILLRYLTSSWGSCTLFTSARGHISLRVENVTWINFGPLAFILHFSNQFWIASRLVSVRGYYCSIVGKGCCGRVW